MYYELIKDSMNDLDNIRDTVLKNRGLSLDYCKLTDNNLYSFSLLPNIRKAVEIYINHCRNNDNIHIIVDSDVDGFTSASIMYQYTRKIFPNCQITYSLHSGKQHGLGDIDVPDDTQLLIVPDAGTNDIKECQRLSDKLDILILDHHNIEYDNPFAVVVNSKAAEYPNHELSGVGVVYKFLQALDEELWEFSSDDYLDLVALGNIADMVDIRNFETKRLCDKGLSNIKNNLFKALIQKQFDAIHNKCTIFNVQFYVVPLINALIRMGTAEEKHLMFKAFIQETEYFDYTPRGKEKNREDIYTRVARLCGNAKARQKKVIDKATLHFDSLIIKQGFQDSVIFVNATNSLDNTLTGVMANKLANKYNRPCVVLQKKTDDTYSGSGRNCKNSYIENFNQVLKDTAKFISVAGHNNAFGVCIRVDEISKVISLLNTHYPFKEVPLKVDFIVDVDDFNAGVVKRFEDFKQYCGQGIEEPMIVIENLIIRQDNFCVMGKTQNTWKYTSDKGISYVKFGIDTNTDEIVNILCDDWSDNKEVVVNLIGTCNMNCFGGKVTPQFIVNDYEVVK